MIFWNRGRPLGARERSFNRNALCIMKANLASDKWLVASIGV